MVTAGELLAAADGPDQVPSGTYSGNRASVTMDSPASRRTEA